jgi:hypothetical protein
MALAETAAGPSFGIGFLIASEVMFTAIAACCSSPQTAELNADRRAETLMKWVHVGLVMGILLVAVASVCDRKRAGSYIAGGAVTGGSMYLMYAHARSSGLASSEPGTES